ncbi:MAG: SDR family oxidoreductase [Elusimicrobia bacterium]|nr:SDR family oxidoreductase [Elusimicrobiota bacterium]
MGPSGKAVLITGGARIGQGVAEGLARAGCSVAVTFHSSRLAALETVRRVESLGARGVAIRADLGRPATLKSVIGKVVRTFGRLDILVNMASRYERIPLQGLAKTSGRENAFKKSIAIDLRAAYELSLLAAPHMKKAGGGRIINFVDWVVASGRPRYSGYIPYYTAKAGLKGLTEILALELAPIVLVNAIAPGPILAPRGLPASVNREVLANTPLGRWGGPEEIAKAVLFLVQSDFVTGETLRVDGGRHLY